MKGEEIAGKIMQINDIFDMSDLEIAQKYENIGEMLTDSSCNRWAVIAGVVQAELEVLAKEVSEDGLR